MDKLIILGSGAAPGVPVIGGYWGKCKPENPKNKRQRAGIYTEIGNSRILIDTSADLRNQLLDNGICQIDAVLYTHTHADHTMGIDDLRAFGYKKKCAAKQLGIYATALHLQEIRHRFNYVLADEQIDEITNRPYLYPNIIEYNKQITIGNIKVMPLEFSGHTILTTGFCFNEGKLVIIPDYRTIPETTLAYLSKINVDVLIMPLTSIDATLYHADIKTNFQYINIIKPKRVFFTHLGPECDFDEVENITPSFIHPAYDNMLIEL